MDLISRQDVIDAIETTTWYHQNKSLEMVSGANSKEHQAWYKAEDVFDAIENVPSTEDLSSVEQDIAQIVINAMDMRRWLSDKAERKKGKWIQNKKRDDQYKCSSCGREVWYPWGIDVFVEKYNFCPNCGSRNEVQKGEQNG